MEPVAVKVFKVRDHSGPGVKFNFTLVPAYVHRSAHVSAVLSCLSISRAFPLAIWVGH